MCLSGKSLLTLSAFSFASKMESSIDESDLLVTEKSGVLYFGMEDVFKLGIESIMSKTVNHFKEKVDAVPGKTVAEAPVV